MTKTLLACALVVAAVLASAAPASPFGLRLGATAGVGVVGPDQYDSGKAKGIFTAGTDGFFQPKPFLSFGGLGLGFRASWGLYTDFSEVGVTFPFVTVRRGLWMTQTGLMIQRMNVRKHLYYIGTGISLPKRSGKGQPDKGQPGKPPARPAPAP